jgi:hypothetical protein
MYEGDGIIRQGPAVDARPDPQEKPAEALPHGHSESKTPKPVRNLRRLLAWVRRKLQTDSAIEEYLSRASSLADVERLLRKAERERYFLQP